MRLGTEYIVHFIPVERIVLVKKLRPHQETKRIYQKMISQLPPTWLGWRIKPILLQ